MNHFLGCLLLFASTVGVVYGQSEPPQQSLNQYVAFLNQSVEVLTRRFEMVRTYQTDVNRYHQTSDFLLRLPSSGPIEDYYYRKALATNGLTAADKQRLTTGAQALWQLLTKLDQAGKALETYVRLKTYQADNLNQSDALVAKMQTMFGQFSRDKTVFYGQIQQVYRRYQPALPNDPYLAVEKEMVQILLSQQQLLDSLPYYLNENSPSVWPVAQVQRSMLADEKWLSVFGKSQPAVGYPASDAVNRFRADIMAMQALKRRAIDNNTFAARQSARHGNAVYLALLNQFNQGLLASHRTFVNASKSARNLLDYPLFSPVITPEPRPAIAQPITQAAPFQDKPRPAFATKRAAAPASRATTETLNGYVEWINESLRQMHRLQGSLRTYQESAEYHHDPSRSNRRADLTYSHEDYAVPVSAYQLLLTNSMSIPATYRAAITTQAEVLLGILREMDDLSIELIAYTKEKQYLTDRLTRSDAILDRYAYLFLTFDQKKEQLYTDIRNVYESYPVANPASSWQLAGQALRNTLDDDNAILFGVKAFLNGEETKLPGTSKAETDARQLIADEYQNLNGLPRYGRNNGLCPYSPYEDLAENSLRFAGMAQTVKPASAGSTRHPYESFYFFYNNELVYQYNKFSELAIRQNIRLLKAINQPDLFAFRRLPTPAGPDLIAVKTGSTPNKRTANADPIVADTPRKRLPVVPASGPITPGNNPTMPPQHDTVYVNLARVDTVYIDRTDKREVSPSLAGFAANNMVLLLDVSGSMDSPVKLPLLKRAIKSLLGLLRAEDQLSIVIYSGKARVVLKPTSGTEASNIARVIDELQSDGGTDANGGLRLAYKVANKNYLRAGNNRIILATDGEFPISKDVLDLVGENARQDIHLTVFTFGRNPLTSQNLQKLSQAGGGTYAHVTTETADLQLIMEAQAKKEMLK